MDLLLQGSHVDFACIHNIVVMELSQPTKLISMQMKYTPRSVLDTTSRSLKSLHKPQIQLLAGSLHGWQEVK